MGMTPGVDLESERGIFPLPRFLEVRESPAAGGHSKSRQRRRLGRLRESNRVLRRLEELSGGRLREVVEEEPPPRPTHCGRSVRSDAAAEVWRAVCTHDPPLPLREGVDALTEIAEDHNSYAGLERGDIVSKDEAFAEWMSLPSGKVGSFQVIPSLGQKRREQYEDIENVLEEPKLAAESAAGTNAFMGLHPEQYALLVGRMLRIGMVNLASLARASKFNLVAMICAPGGAVG